MSFRQKTYPEWKHPNPATHWTYWNLICSLQWQKPVSFICINISRQIKEGKIKIASHHSHTKTKKGGSQINKMTDGRSNPLPVHSSPRLLQTSPNQRLASSCLEFFVHTDVQWVAEKQWSWEELSYQQHSYLDVIIVTNSETRNEEAI